MSDYKLCRECGGSMILCDKNEFDLMVFAISLYSLIVTTIIASLVSLVIDNERVIGLIAVSPILVSFTLFITEWGNRIRIYLLKRKGVLNCIKRKRGEIL